MATILISADVKPSSWIKHIHRLAPDIEVRLWPACGDPGAILMALVWNHPPGVLKRFPNLKCIASLGAGVDHILQDRQLPRGVTITRVVEPSMARSMSEYVALAVLNHCRQTEDYRRDQIDRRWRPRVPLLARKVRIGIMGMGQLGSHAAGHLSRLGFAVSGWRRTPKELPPLKIYAGPEGMAPFLAQSDILICMLPLTASTEGILNAGTFAGLPRGAYLVNVARGRHLVETDLLAALDSGQLSGACLDVFREEPLPAAHPFWTHPKISVTPHISSLTYPRAVAPQLVENYRRLIGDKPLLNVVDPARGY